MNVFGYKLDDTHHLTKIPRPNTGVFVENSTTQLEMVVENRALGVKKSKLQHFPEVGTLGEGSVVKSERKE